MACKPSGRAARGRAAPTRPPSPRTASPSRPRVRTRSGGRPGVAKPGASPTLRPWNVGEERFPPVSCRSSGAPPGLAPGLLGLAPVACPRPSVARIAGRPRRRPAGGAERDLRAGGDSPRLSNPSPTARNAQIAPPRPGFANVQESCRIMDRAVPEPHASCPGAHMTRWIRRTSFDKRESTCPSYAAAPS